MNQLEKLKQEAAKLPSKDRQELLDHLALQSRTSINARHKDSRDLDLWCSALHDILARDTGALGVGLPGLAVIRKTVAPLFAPIESFMVATKLQPLKVPDRQAVYHLLARLLVEHAKRASARSHIPLSLKFVASCSTAIPGLFEDAFPGYIDAGLARVVASSLSRPRENLVG